MWASALEIHQDRTKTVFENASQHTVTSGFGLSFSIIICYGRKLDFMELSIAYNNN